MGFDVDMYIHSFAGTVAHCLGFDVELYIVL